MDRMVEVNIGGQKRQMNYSVEIMFDVNEKYGGLAEALDTATGSGVEAFKVVQWLVIRMVNDAELCRRDAGYDPLPMLTENDVSMRMHPYEYEEIKEAVADAVAAGYRREMEDDGEVDIGLAELNAKKTKAGE